jgi:2-oxo-4-hydroxy-4-carboxy-5-ureidoimidazoline decarboxylase
MPVGATRGELLSCCASTTWADAVAAAGPFDTWDELVAAALARLAALEWADVLEALDAHPRIGDRVPGADLEAAWSRQEQAGVAGAADDTLRTLAAGNAMYERRFGHVFLICAAGKSAGAMLAELGDRLDHSPVVEQDVVRAELAAITRLRLRKLAETHSESHKIAHSEPSGAAP